MKAIIKKYKLLFGKNISTVGTTGINACGDSATKD